MWCSREPSVPRRRPPVPCVCWVPCKERSTRDLGGRAPGQPREIRGFEGPVARTLTEDQGRKLRRLGGGSEAEASRRGSAFRASWPMWPREWPTFSPSGNTPMASPQEADLEVTPRTRSRTRSPRTDRPPSHHLLSPRWSAGKSLRASVPIRSRSCRFAPPRPVAPCLPELAARTRSHLNGSAWSVSSAPCRPCGRGGPTRHRKPRRRATWEGRKPQQMRDQSIPLGRHASVPGESIENNPLEETACSVVRT